MRFEPNLSMLFTESPVLDRPRMAAAAGFTAAEMWWPFDTPEPGDVAVAEFATAFEEAGISLACLNFYGGDFDAGERGLVGIPGAQDRFRANIDIAVGLAERLGCMTLNALYGNRISGISVQAHDEVAIENIALAVSAADRIGARVVVEALNPDEYPRYGLHNVDDVVAFTERTREAAGLETWCLLDIYHVTMSGDRLADVIERHGDRIGHVQIADVPGRHEPGTGTIDFPALFEMLRGRGYDGWIGLEYVPSSDTHTSVHATMNHLADQQRTDHGV